MLTVYIYTPVIKVIYNLIFLLSFFLIIVNSVDGLQRTRYVWQTGGWRECESDRCGGTGSTTRSVQCVEASTNRTVQMSDCVRLSKPTAYTTCIRICDYHKHQYHWYSTEWSKCQPHSINQRCTEDYGIQYRKVSCVSKCGGMAKTEAFCEYFQPKPVTKQMCSLECPKNCITTEFKAWTMCSSCFQKQKSRQKNVLRAPANGGSECRNLVDYAPCKRSSECYETRLNNYQYKLSDWSECQPLDRKMRKRLHVSHSFLGRQNRTIKCIDVTGMEGDASFCAHISHNKQPLHQRICVIPHDCLVSHWTTWANWTSSGRPYPSGTKPPHMDPVSRQRGSVMVRQRNLIQVPRGDGKACPKLEQQKVTDPGHDVHVKACERYHWTTGPWGVCQGNLELDKCGSGVQHRTVLCTRTKDGLTVEDYHCESEAPPLTRSCDLHCPTDCDVSEWGHWGDCLPDKCHTPMHSFNTHGYRIRRRYVKQNSQHGGKECPHLEEYQDCVYPPCYSWATQQPSSECTLKYKDMNCGEGHRQKVIYCTDLYGTTIDDRFCEYHPKPADTEPCHIPCGDDCVVTSWSIWSQCPSKQQQCASEDVITRTRSRKILAYSGNGGRSCPPDRQLKDTGNCPQTNCKGYFWMAEQWDPCSLRNTVMHCGKGFQIRQVTCHKSINCNEGRHCSYGRKASAKHCVDSLKPAERQNCSVKCPQDCKLIVSNFTQWSPCSESCISDDAPKPTRQRYRFIMDDKYAEECAHIELMEAEMCDNLPTCLHYEWKVSKWSQCVTMTGCGEGYQARDVRCINNNMESLQEEICISQLGSMPDRVAPCKVSQCNEGCHFSDWSQWTGCDKRCGGTRYRYRSMQGSTKKRVECYDSKYPTKEKGSCDFCSKYNRQLHGRWSSCLLISNQEENPDRKYKGDNLAIGMLRHSSSVCGIGRRYQALVCTDSRGSNVSANVCYQKDFEEEICFIICPEDCVMNEWSSWSTCQTENRCGNGLRSRFRYVEKPALDGGRPCPQLTEGEQYQYDPCHIQCEQYFWEAGPWSTCTVGVKLDHTQRCGSGLQTRTVRCMKKVNSQSTVTVDGSLCDSVNKPADHNLCDVICVGHCVLSEWTDYTSCPQNCHGKKSRSRSIVRKPTKGTMSCSHRTEIHDCIEGSNCFRYTLSRSKWGSCVLPANSECGVGIRRSYTECIRSDGTVVDRQYCKQVAEVEDVLIEECTVTCAVDCVVSEWTPWTECSKSCDLGYQHRIRHILVYPNSQGRSCPVDMSQERPCSFTECFRWDVTDWGHCEILHGACGFGTHVRNLTCIRHDGLRMDTTLCPEGGKTHFTLTRGCLKPCPDDCWVSDWSSWGPCHRPCVPEINEGVQTRSRAITSQPDLSSGGHRCPTDLIQTRSCHGGYCPRYTWKTSFWFGDRRHVWCEGSDGMAVEGGCDLNIRPASNLTCTPGCDVINSYCSDINHCSCLSGYSAVYNNYGVITDCQQLVAMHNRSKHTSEVLLPADGLTNFWMYAVIAAGSGFILFVVVAIYVIMKYSRRDRQNEMSLRSSRSTTIRKNMPGQKSLVIKETTTDTYKEEYS